MDHLIGGQPQVGASQPQVGASQPQTGGGFGEYAGDFLKQRLGNFLELAALGTAARGGGLGGEIQRLVLGRQNPEVQAGLINSPFLSGTYFAGGERDRNNPQAVDLGGGLGPSAPNPTYPFVPNLPHGPGLDINSIMAMMQNGQAGGQLRPTYKFDKKGQPSLSLTERSQTGQNVPVFDTYEGAGGAEVGTTPTGQTIIKLQNGKFLLRNPPPLIQTEFGATPQPVGPLKRPVIQRLPNPKKFSSETVLGTEPVPGTGQNIPTARVPQSGLAQKIASAESAFTTMKGLLEPVVDPRTGLKGPTPISSLGRGKLAATLTGLPGGRTGQEYLIGRTSKLPGLEGDAARKLLSAIGNRSIIAKQTGEVGNLAEQEQKVIEDAFIPNGSDTEDSARRKIELYIQTFGRAVEALRATGNPDTAKEIWFQGAAQASGISQTTPSTGTTIPQQQNVAPGYNGAPSSQSAPAATGTNRAVKLKNGTTLNVIVH